MESIRMGELALRYFPKSNPKSAVTQLRKWIVRCTPLRERLDELYFKKGQRVLTPLQHEAILQDLGDPGE